MDYKQVATAIYDGITSMPLDLVYGAKRTYLGSGALGSEYKLRNEEENERLFRSIKMGIDNRKPIYRNLYINLCNCLILICSIQHQKQVNLWTKNSCRLWLTNWP
ncbi:hypothetical protein, partial [Serratia ficaria]|uniref:hypothetical protein n=1 Tax=Serratia ficaria TaxID=61651 RepID=UPI003704A129